MDEKSPIERRNLGEIWIGSFFEGLRVLKDLEEQASRPLGKGDPLLQAKIREVRTYLDTYMKMKAKTKPEIRTQEEIPEPGKPIPLVVEFEDAIHFYEGLSLSLAKGGIFIKSDVLLQIDTLLELDIRLRKENLGFKVSGKVIWMNPNETQGKPAGMGIKFYKLTSNQRQILNDFLAGGVTPEILTMLSEEQN